MRERKALVLLKDAYDVARILARPVICDQHLEIQIVLLRDTIKHHVERCGPVIRGDDYGDLRLVGHAL